MDLSANGLKTMALTYATTTACVTVFKLFSRTSPALCSPHEEKAFVFSGVAVTTLLASTFAAANEQSLNVPFGVFTAGLLTNAAFDVVFNK